MRYFNSFQPESAKKGGYLSNSPDDQKWFRTEVEFSLPDRRRCDNIQSCLACYPEVSSRVTVMVPLRPVPQDISKACIK